MSGKETKSEAETDLDRARERLSFYEQFDSIIQQNIASSSALLKEASERFDSDVAEERRKYRTLLSDILDDLTVLQSQSERLARRVSDALDDLENKLPAPGETAAVPLAATQPLLAAEAPPETAAVIGTVPPSRKKPKSAPQPDSPVAAPSLDRSPPVPPLPIVELPPVSLATSTTLLVHGVPRASAALGLKSYIEKLDFVHTVEPREFAAGMLRLQVDGARPLTIGDLAGWNMADRIELKNASNDLLEVGLVPA